jgi:hypothetical protein
MITYGYPSPRVEFYDDDLFDVSSSEEAIDLSFIIQEDEYIQHLIQGDEL